MASNNLAAQIVAAHGGSEHFARLGTLRLVVSTGGLLLASRWQGAALRGASVEVSSTSQRITFEPFPRPGLRGVFSVESVALHTPEGAVVAERTDPRSRMHGLRNQLHWDKLDFLYYAGCSLWQSLCLPLLLTDPEFESEQLAPVVSTGRTWHRLAVTVPSHFHAHSNKQVLAVSDDGLIRRADYTVQEAGNYVRAGDYATEYEKIQGLQIATRRAVHPLRRNLATVGWPRLSWTELWAPERFPQPVDHHH